MLPRSVHSKATERQTSELGSFVFFVCKHLADKRREFRLRQWPNMSEITPGIRTPIEVQPMTWLIELSVILRRDFEVHFK
jgi:hypothetical protein